MDPDFLLSQRILSLRKSLGYTLEELAERSGVSRSMISLIERQKTSPTATVLNKLADALGVSLPALFSDEEGRGERQPLSRAQEQPLWTDPASGYQRRQLSPMAWASPLDLTEVTFPAGETVSFDNLVRSSVIHQQVWMLEGSMAITIGRRIWVLEVGDCLAMQLGERVIFHNPKPATARYLLALISSPTFSSRPL